MAAIALIWWQNRVDWAVSISGSVKSYQKSIHIHWMSKCLTINQSLWATDYLQSKQKNLLVTRYTFIDLAQIVCKLPETRHEKLEPSSSSDEEYDGYISEPTTLVSKPFFCYSVNLFFDRNVYLRHSYRIVIYRCAYWTELQDRCRYLKTKWTRTSLNILHDCRCNVRKWHHRQHRYPMIRNCLYRLTIYRICMEYEVK